MGARAMATATSRRAAVGVLALALSAAGCGGSSAPSVPGGGAPSVPGGGVASAPGAGVASVPGGGVASVPGAGAFAWLRPAPSPAGWRVARIASGAAMPYPPSWRPTRGDAGTATAVLLGSGRRFLGYLNITPRQGGEAPSTWGSFRVAHNADEGDREVRQLAAAQGLRFRTGHGSCVRDAYTTSTGVRFVELACLVAGPKAASVIVGAAPPEIWAKIAPSIELAISAMTT